MSISYGELSHRQYPRGANILLSYYCTHSMCLAGDLHNTLSKMFSLCLSHTLQSSNITMIIAVQIYIHILETNSIETIQMVYIFCFQ